MKLRSQHVVIGASHFDLFVLLIKDEIVASAQCQFAEIFCAIARIFVDVEHRNKGLASVLIRRIEKQAKQQGKIGCHALIENASFDNLMPFYMKLGYTPVYQFPDGDVIFSKTL